MKNLILMALLVFAGLGGAQERAVPVEREPLHKVVFKNDYVEVMRATILPQQSTVLHTHSHDRVAVHLSESQLKEDVPGNRPRNLVVYVGDVSAGASAKQPFSHRLKNVGKSMFEVIDVELLKRPDGPSTRPIATPAAETLGLRAYRWVLDPGASTPEHTHSRPYLIIASTQMQLAMTAPDGSSMEHPVKAGDLHWIDGKVTHTLANKGKESGKIIEVELK